MTQNPFEMSEPTGEQAWNHLAEKIPEATRKLEECVKGQMGINYITRQPEFQSLPSFAQDWLLDAYDWKWQQIWGNKK